MRILKKATLRDFWKKHSDSKVALETWHKETVIAKWKTPKDIAKSCSRCSILSNNRVVFRLKGNSYRLVVKVEYDFDLVFIRFIGTHTEYDKIDASTI